MILWNNGCKRITNYRKLYPNNFFWILKSVSENIDQACTPTKRKLFQNQNLQILIDSFESTAGESTLNRNESSESPAKRRKYELVAEVINPIGQGHGDGTNFDRH